MGEEDFSVIRRFRTRDDPGLFLDFCDVRCGRLGSGWIFFFNNMISGSDYSHFD